MNTHRTKVRLARSMRTPLEAAEGVSIFDSKAWIERKNARARRAALPANYKRVRYNTPVIEVTKKKAEPEPGVIGKAKRLMKRWGIASSAKGGMVSRKPSV
jgi:hypothetical protein